MKLILITLSIICINNFHSQVINDVDAPKALSTDCFFNVDGSFSVSYTTGSARVLSYVDFDKNGVLIPEEKLPFYKFISKTSKNYYDESSNTFYTLEPYNPIHFGVKPKEVESLNQIWSHSPDQPNAAPEVVKFTSSLNTEKMKKSKMFLIDNKNASFKNKSGNIVWYEAICGTNPINPKNNIVKNDMYSFLKRTELNVSNNTVTTKMSLINKSVDGEKQYLNDKYYYQIINVLGILNNKVYVSYSTQSSLNYSKKMIDVWSYNDETGEEKLEYSYTFVANEKDAYINQTLMPKSLNNKDGSLFFYLSYSSILDKKNNQRAIHYKIIEVTNNDKIVFRELDIPEEKITTYSNSPELFCYQKETENNFYFEVSTDGKTANVVNFKQNSDGDLEAVLLPGTYNSGVEIFLDPLVSDDRSEFINLIYSNIEEKCTYCEEVVKSTIYKSSTEYRILTLNYTKSLNTSYLIRKNIKARLFTIPIPQ